MNWRALFDRLLGTAPETTDILDAAAHVPRGMSRRTFLRGALAATAIAATVDVEQLLWTPGEKTLFVPTLDELAAYGHNYPFNPDWVTREALRCLQNNLQLAGRMTREYGARFDRRSHRVGDTIRLQLPVRFEPFGDFSGAIVEPTIDVTLDQQHGIEFEPPTAADQKHPARYIERTLDPAMQNLAFRMKRAGIDVCADLPSRPGAALASRDGLCIRGIADLPTHRVRIEVLGGSTTPRRRRA